MRESSRRILSGVAVGMMCLIMVLPALAQPQGRARGRVYNKAEVDRVIERVEDRSDAFVKLVDRSLDRSRLDGSRTEDNLNRQVKQLEKALDELRREFDRRQAWVETKSQVQAVVNQADEINAWIRRSRTTPDIERQWAALRRDINTLADVYNIRRLR